MIFYFTGTGNSLSVATKLAAYAEDTVSDMAEAVKQSNTVFSIKEQEKIGFVFPVYYYGMPTIVAQFLSSLKLSRVPVYTYAVLTCAGSVGACPDMIKDRLEVSNIPLNALFTVIMPDSYMLLYDVQDKNTVNSRLAIANTRIELIWASIKNMENVEFKVSILEHIKTKLFYRSYVKGRNTRKFYASTNCIGCGKCEQNCPDTAIQIINHRPRWTKDKCSLCMACINRCPSKAIQYGSMTINRGRYINPILRGK